MKLKPHSLEPLELTTKQEKVLEAAIDLFAENGFERSSTSEIAERAGVAEGTIFKRFSTKKDLLIAVGIYIVSKISLPNQAREVASILGQPHERVEDMFQTLLTNRLEFVGKNRRMLRVMIQELPFHPELQRVAKEIIGKTLIPAATQAIDRYKQKGQLRDLPSITIFRMMVGQFMAYLLTRHVIAPQHDWNDEQEVQQILDVLMKGLRPVKG
jgi:AcrR family transcriptional regulator